MSNEESSTPIAAPGWYTDPSGSPRWWDGTSWVDNLPNYKPATSASVTSTTSNVVGTICIVMGLIVGIVGLGWIVLFYLTQGLLPFAGLGSWNILGGLLIWLVSLVPFIVGLVLIRHARQA